MSSDARQRFATSVVAALLALTALAGAAASAHADGDPASDVLAVQKLFLPSDANVPARDQLELAGLLNQSARRGYPLRVAIVASANDLGSVTALWRQPENYARFLGSELGLMYHGTLLVVMPNGYGVDVTARGARTASGVVKLRVPGQHLGTAAITAVERFARAAGTPLTQTAGLRTKESSPGSDMLPWLVFGLGFVPLIAAWGLSLRRQPLTLRARQH